MVFRQMAGVSAIVLALASCSGGSDKSASAAVTTSVKGSSAPISTSDPVRSKDRVSLTGFVVPDGGGFVVVYADAGGVPGVRLGASKKLKAGVLGDVGLDVAGSDPVWVMVHRDVDGDGSLKFPGPDVPVVDPKSGSIVSVLISLAKVPS